MEAYAGVDACLSSIDRDERHRAAAMVAANAMLASRIGHHDAAEAWFNLAIERAEDVESKAALVYRASLALLRRGRTDMIPRLEQYADCVSSLSAALNATLATAYVMAERPNDAIRRAYRARDILASNAASLQRSRTLYQIAYVALRTGELNEAKTFAREAVESARREGDYDIAARGYSLLYELAYIVDCDPRRALRYLRLVESCAAQSGDAHVRAWASMGAFYIAIEAGDMSEALTHERALSAIDIVQGAEEASEALVPAQALRWAWGRDFKRAYSLVAESGESQISTDRRARRYAEAALYAAADGLREESISAIESADWTFSHATFKTKGYIIARAFLMLAAALTLGVDAARPRLEHLRALRGEAPPGIAAFIDATEAVYRSWCGEQNHEQLLASFAALREQYLGGLSMLLEALPVAQRQ
jgi:tetratricopeptide (TPR) repeat protein